MIIIVAMSVLLQFIAALFALRLIPITGRKTAWLFGRDRYLADDGETVRVPAPPCYGAIVLCA
jgi:hypothetical protein